MKANGSKIGGMGLVFTIGLMVLDTKVNLEITSDMDKAKSVT